MHLSIVWKGLKKKEGNNDPSKLSGSQENVCTQFKKKNQTKILPWLQGPPLHTPLLVVDIDSPEPSKLARAGAEWAGGQRGREFTGNFKKKTKKKGKKVKKKFLLYFCDTHECSTLHYFFHSMMLAHICSYMVKEQKYQTFFHSLLLSRSGGKNKWQKKRKKK